VYKITDTYDNKSVTGTASVDSDNNIVINLTIDNENACLNIFPSQNTYGINATVEQLDSDLMKYMIDVATNFINE
jgi:hypothetical protein